MRTYVWYMGVAGQRPGWQAREVVSRPAAIRTVLLAAVLMLSVARAMPGHQPPAAYVAVTVEAGDSLWSIAARYDPAVDPRRIVEQIMARNGLRSAIIMPGQRLEVPTR